MCSLFIVQRYSNLMHQSLVCYAVLLVVHNSLQKVVYTVIYSMHKH